MTLQTFGRYKIVNLIGQGGMAEVYAAKDPELGRLVALKIITSRFSEDPNFQERFLKEAQIVAGLEHRAIVPVYDFGQDPVTKNLYLVMRLMPDVLNKRLERQKIIPLEDASLILNRLAVALNRAHSQAIVHRDIKPANILLDEEGTVFLADFGLAAPMERIEAGMLPSAFGGSPFYMAPEQWRGEKVGPYTDIYQLGVTLFEMLAGERPFPESDAQLLPEQHLNGHIPHATDLNPRLVPNIQPILEKAMAKAPSERYSTVLELANEVANLLRPRRIKRRYEIKEELQHGRFATVFQVQDLIDEQLVALKILNEPLLLNHRYQQEFLQQRAELLRLPEHPALLPVYDVDVHEEKPFIAMKFIEGASLRDRFRKESAFSVEQVCEIARQLAEGLDALHENGQVHGDINMDNVLIDSNGNCILSDFHITAVVEQTRSVLEQAKPLAYLPYLAPEQWTREPLVPQTDVYQFGMLMYELLTGQRPFAETAMLEMQQMITKEMPPPITSLAAALPPQFDKVFDKALAKKPEERFATASELVRSLSAAWQSHSFDLFVWKGNQSYEAKQWDAAIAAYSQALGINPDSQAVSDKRKRAERRKQDDVALEQCRQAIDNERWRDAEYFLSRASNTPEKRTLQAVVQRKLQVEQLYNEGRLAMQQQAWFIAQQLLDQADSLEPNYRDVNVLLGQLAETIDECMQQAREAMAIGELDRALVLLEPVADLEPAVKLRQEIAAKHQIMPVLPKELQMRRRILGWGIVGLLGIAVVAAFFIFNGRLTDEEKLECLKTAVPELHINHTGDVLEYVLMQGESAPIPSTWQQFDMFVEWGSASSLSAACQRFINDDSTVESIWEPDIGEIEETMRWAATYTSSSSSPDHDRIVLTLSYDGQLLTNVFLLNFQP